MSSKLETQTKYVTIVIRKNGYPIDFETKLLEFVTSECNTYAYIKHSQDINGYGEVESLHYHLVLEYKERKRLSTHLYYLCSFFGFDNSNGIEIGKTLSVTRSIQYLIHKNNPEKTQHDISEIVTNYAEGDLKVIIESESDNVINFEYIMKLVKENPSKLHLISTLGLNTYKTYRNVILDIIDEVRKEAHI